MPCAGLEEVNLLFDWLLPLFCGGCKSGRSSIRPGFWLPIQRPEFSNYEIHCQESSSNVCAIQSCALRVDDRTVAVQPCSH